MSTTIYVVKYIFPLNIFLNQVCIGHHADLVDTKYYFNHAFLFQRCSQTYLHVILTYSQQQVLLLR